MHWHCIIVHVPRNDLEVESKENNLSKSFKLVYVHYANSFQSVNKKAFASTKFLTSFYAKPCSYDFRDDIRLFEDNNLIKINCVGNALDIFF